MGSYYNTPKAMLDLLKGDYIMQNVGTLYYDIPKAMLDLLKGDYSTSTTFHPQPKALGPRHPESLSSRCNLNARSGRTPYVGFSIIQGCFVGGIFNKD